MHSNVLSHEMSSGYWKRLTLNLYSSKVEQKTCYSDTLKLYVRDMRWVMSYFLLLGKAFQMLHKHNSWEHHSVRRENNDKLEEVCMKWRQTTFLSIWVCEVFVEVITRISSQLWECGAYQACAKSRWQRVLRKYDPLNASIRETVLGI